MDVLKKASILLAILSFIFITVATVGTIVTSPTTVVGKEGSDVNISFPNAAPYVFVHFWSPISRFATSWNGLLSITTTGSRPNISFVGNVRKQQYVFQLSNLTAEDTGRYVCSESSESADPEISGCVVNVRIRERPFKPQVVLSTPIPEIGQQAVYECLTDSTATPSLQFVWRLNGRVIHRSENTRVSITARMADLGKLLTCQVVDEDLQSPESRPVWHNVLCHGQVDDVEIYTLRPNVKSEPILVPDLHTLGQMALYDPRCKRIGNFTLGLMTAQLVDPSRFEASFSVSMGNVLYLNSPQTNDTGVYTCSYPDQSTNFLAHCGFVLYVLEDELPAPTVIQMATLGPDGTATVRCFMDWEPTFLAPIRVKYQFEVHHSLVASSGMNFLVIDLGHRVLTVRCRAIVGRLYSTFSEPVQVGPQVGNFSIRFNVNSPLVLEEGMEDPPLVTCAPSCQPRCRVHWKYSGSSGHVTIPGSTLTFKDVTREDAGLYQCSVFGYFDTLSSQMSRTLEVIVKYKPSITSFTIDGEPWKRVGLNESVTLKCEGKGREPPLVFIQSRGGAPSPSGVTHDEGSVTWQLDRIQCAHGGDYVCLLYDFEADPQSPPVEVKKVTLEVMCPPELGKGQPSVQRFFADPGQPFSTTVKVSASPLPSFQLFKLKARWRTDASDLHDSAFMDLFDERVNLNGNQSGNPRDEDGSMPEEETKGKYLFGSTHFNPLLYPMGLPKGGRSRRDPRFAFGREQTGSPGIDIEGRFFRDPTIFMDVRASDASFRDPRPKDGSKAHGVRRRGANEEAYSRTSRQISPELPGEEYHSRRFSDFQRSQDPRDPPSPRPSTGYTADPSTQPTSKGDTGHYDDTKLKMPLDPDFGSDAVKGKGSDSAAKDLGKDYRKLAQKGKGSDGKARGLGTDYSTLAQKGKGSDGKARGLGTDYSIPSGSRSSGRGNPDTFRTPEDSPLYTSPGDSKDEDSKDWRYPSVLEKQWARLQAKGDLFPQAPDPPGVDWLAKGHVISQRLELYDPQLVRTLHPACDGTLNLTFDPLKDEDFGVYGVSFWNSLGAGVAVIFLQKRGPPDQPLGVRCEPTSPRSLDVSWMPSYDNGDDVTAYHIDLYNRTDVSASHNVKHYEIISVRQDLDKRARMWHEITDLRPDTDYAISVYAENVRGFSHTPDTLLCRTESDVASRQKNLAIMCLTAILLAISVPSFLGVLIFQSKVAARCCLKLCRFSYDQGEKVRLCLPFVSGPAKFCVPTLEKCSCGLRQKWLHKHADLLGGNVDVGMELGPLPNIAL